MVQEEIEEHFRNICESCSPIVDKDAASNANAAGSGAGAAKEADDDLIGDLGNIAIDEGPRSKPILKTKPKPKPVPHYLTGTAASRAMQRPKSPLIGKMGTGDRKTMPGMKPPMRQNTTPKRQP